MGMFSGIATAAAITITIAITTVALLIWILLQGKHTKATAIRLPEAPGLRQCEQAGEYSLLHIGESTVAGVGVDDLQQGLTAQLIRHLQNLQKQDWRWQILGENGARVADMLNREVSFNNPNVLVLTFGVNDTTRFTPARRWAANLSQCVDTYAAAGTRVFVTAVPPMHRFPLLPAPLKWLLGIKAAQLDRTLRRLASVKGWHYVGNKFQLTEQYMAHDGYHPNRDGYQVWGQWIAEHVATRIGEP